MNYLAVYERLIQRAKRRSLTGVVEIHHIMPKCLGGTNEEFNLVKLTPEEHYTAHQLLVKIYASNSKLLWAAIAMTGTGNGIGNGRRGNKLYGWLKRRFIQGQIGRFYSEDTRQKIGSKSKERNQGKNHPMSGRKHSDEARAKMRAAQIGNGKGKKKGPWSDERKQAMSHQRKEFYQNGGAVNFKGRKHTLETRAKMREYWARRRQEVALTLNEVTA